MDKSCTSTAENSRRQLKITLALTASYLVAEVIGGLLSGSLALLADAGHMLSDVAALALTLFAFWIAQRPASAKATYGYHRAEILAALANGTALLIIAVFIALEAYERMFAPEPVAGGLMLAVATGGLLVNLIALAILHSGKNADLNMRGAFLHVLSDALGSVGAMVLGRAHSGLRLALGRSGRITDHRRVHRVRRLASDQGHRVGAAGRRARLTSMSKSC